MLTLRINKSKIENAFLVQYLQSLSSVLSEILSIESLVVSELWADNDPLNPFDKEQSIAFSKGRLISGFGSFNTRQGEKFLVP